MLYTSILRPSYPFSPYPLLHILHIPAPCILYLSLTYVPNHIFHVHLIRYEEVSSPRTVTMSYSWRLWPGNNLYEGTTDLSTYLLIHLFAFPPPSYLYPYSDTSYHCGLEYNNLYEGTIHLPTYLLIYLPFHRRVTCIHYLLTYLPIYLYPSPLIYLSLWHWNITIVTKEFYRWNLAEKSHRIGRGVGAGRCCWTGTKCQDDIYSLATFSTLVNSL